MTIQKTTTLVLVCLLGISSTLEAQAIQSPPAAAETTCAAERGEIGNVRKEELIRQKMADLLSAKTPLTAPASVQLGAPSSTGAATTLVEGASFPALLGLALESDLVEVKEDVVTLNVNPFAIGAAFNRDLVNNPAEYAATAAWRRLGFSLSFGGKGESFDRTGDGAPDPAFEAEDRTDIITYEARYRIGTRDRRDKFDEVQKAVAGKLDTTHAEWVRFNAWYSEALSKLQKNRDCLDAAGFVAFLDRDDVETSLLLVARARSELIGAAEAAFEKIDSAPVWTLVVGGVEREEQFGPAKHNAALRGALGKHWTLNLEWAEIEGIGGVADPTTWKLGTEYSLFVLRQKAIGGDEGIEVSLSGVGEKFEDAPTAKHDTNVKLNAKLELPLGLGVKLPISVTWANHQDLITDEDEVRGHIGFTLSLEDLLKARRAGG